MSAKIVIDIASDGVDCGECGHRIETPGIAYCILFGAALPGWHRCSACIEAQVLAYFNEHGVIPGFSLEKKEEE